MSKTATPISGHTAQAMQLQREFLALNDRVTVLASALGFPSSALCDDDNDGEAELLNLYYDYAGYIDVLITRSIRNTLYSEKERCR